MLKQKPLIQAVTSTSSLPGTSVGETVFKVEKDGQQQQKFKTLQGDQDYLKTFGMKVKMGRFYRSDDSQANGSFVVNETAAKLLGWENPIDKKMGYFHQEEHGSIFGVIEDFNFFSLHNPIEPLVITFNNEPNANMIVRFKPGDEEKMIADVKSVWEEVVPNFPFEYSFLNQSLRDQYAADKNQNTLITAMSVLCIVISLIGLTGLSAFNVNQRQKEIGIRKVLGALTSQIMTIIFADTLKLVILAGVIATPITYFCDQWMDNFAYQAPFNFVLLIIAVLVTIVLTFMIVSTNVIKTARKNPTET
ncbi:MAG: putative ABC transport system permease protein [Roseivirga sp.]|jgi:putative ABC transport system permease protein